MLPLRQESGGTPGELSGIWQGGLPVAGRDAAENNVFVTDSASDIID